MESSVDLLSIPVEILQYLCRYLSLSDVLSSSGTCHYLRSALNHNSVWKRFLPSLDISCLETQYEHVQPFFQKKIQCFLSPLCSNRLLVMKKYHLSHNWRVGSFVLKSEKTEFSYASPFNGVPRGKGRIIYQNRYLFIDRYINDLESDAIEVWDVKSQPVLHCALPLEDLYFNSFYVIGIYLVIVICLKVDVYDINLPDKQFVLKYSFLITDDYATFNEHAHHPNHSEISSECINWFHSKTEQYILSSKFCEYPCLIHVWDILNGSKIGTFLLPEMIYSVTLHSTMGNSWVLTQTFQSGDDNKFFCFDIVNKIFYDYVFKFSGFYWHIIFYLNHALVFCDVEGDDTNNCPDTICSLFDFTTSLKLNERRFDNASKSRNFDSTAVVDGAFIILCDSSFKLVDALSLEILKNIDCDPSLDVISYQFNLFDSVFVLATHANNSDLELWDIKRKTKVPYFLDVVDTKLMYPDEIASKIVYIDSNKINVAHFW